MSSGIYQFWKYYLLRDRKDVESKLEYECTAQPEALTLSSNVPFIFVVLILGLVASVSAFTAENLVYAFKKYGICNVIQVGWRVLL